MKMIKYKYITIALLSLSLFSCDSFLDINESPNNIQVEDITPRLLLPGSMSNIVRVQSRTMNQLGNIYMQNWGGDVNNFTGANTDEYTLSIDNTFYSGIWDGLYPALGNFQRIINYDSENYDNHKAMALIMKSFYMQYLVDLYGDCPYTEAWLFQENVTPAYDDDKEIYRALITNIDDAIALFYGANADDNVVAAEDVMFGGNANKWLRFANTLKIRILLRQSELTDGDTQTYLTDEFAKVQAFGQFLDENAGINPGYSADAAAQLPPFYSLFRTTTAAGTSYDSYVRATAYISDFLNGTVNTVIDPRRGRLYTLEGGVIAGAVQGETTGPDPMSAVGPGLIIGNTQDASVMTLAEGQFLLAEAIEKGYLTGDAQTEFEAGITASFTYLGAGSAAGYIGAIATVDGLGWSGDHIQSIMTQKWLATNGINAIESWIDYTRTGFPNVPLATTATNTKRPYRLLYPTSEYVANSANVPNLLLAQIFVEGPFWKN